MVVAKDLVRPAANGADAFDSRNAVVGNQHTLDDPVAPKPCAHVMRMVLVY